MEKSTYFIKVEDPVASRRKILECTRDVLKTLQGFEAFKEIRHEKAKTIAHLKKQILGLNDLMKEIKRMLPKTNIKTIKKTFSEPKQEKKPIVEVKKLEQELADIESKLNEL